MVKDLKELKILGVMSGTSLDGLDLALCSFSFSGSVWSYKIINARTLPYPDDIRLMLENSISVTADELCRLDNHYGLWLGSQINDFLSSEKLKTDYIASHGHTVFHQPAKGFTLQIGNGNAIAASTGLPVVFDFRSMDVALGGQGAPLVPCGDEYLFSDYDSCLNLGGFSNISYKRGNHRLAFDICPVNMGLNYLANKMGYEFDKDGILGSSGKIISSVLSDLNEIDFYSRKAPKSLGKEWFLNKIRPLLDSKYETRDILRTFYEHIAFQISNILEDIKAENVLVTGGGARNKFLIEQLKTKTKCIIEIPDETLVDFKEALIFAFLGYLRVHGINNVFSSVTGSQKNHCGGIIAGIS